MASEDTTRILGRGGPGTPWLPSGTVHPHQAPPSLAAGESIGMTAPTKGPTTTSVSFFSESGELHAVPYSHKATGYKSKADHCNRSDKHYGGDYRSYHTSYQKTYAPISSREVTFREDGIPVSAERNKGAPLMSPKLPNQAELTAGARFKRKCDTSQVMFGNRIGKDPHQYDSVAHLSYTKYSGGTPSANQGIRAAAAQRLHRNIRLS
ncbi:flagellar associated protein [Pseudoscourfieldia marina]